MAARLGQLLDLPHTEIDGLFHGPNWVPRTDFRDDVVRLTREPKWITEWQYGQVRRMLAERADSLIWLDFSMPVSMTRLVRRTIRRRVRREVLWHGNAEAPLHTIFTNPDHIIRWGWQTRNKLKTLVPELDSNFPGLRVVRLTTPKDAEKWLERVAVQATPTAGHP